MLTSRTECIITHVTKRTVADIGTDHAYIPIALIERDMCDKVIATDIKQGPVDIAVKNIEKYGYSDKITVRKGAGLIPVNEGECEECIISGMGGLTIRNILEEKTLDGCSYILQPMNCQYELRKYLYENGFQITFEDLALEGFKVYNILCVKKGKVNPPEDEMEYHIPYSLTAHKYINELKAKKRREFTKIKNGIEKSAVPDENLIKYYEELLDKLDFIGKIE